MVGEGGEVGGCVCILWRLELVGLKGVYVNVVWIHIECLWPLKNGCLFIYVTKTVSSEYRNRASR